MAQTQKYITNAEIARILGISRAAVSKQLSSGLKDGTIKYIQKGKSELIDKDTLPDGLKKRMAAAQRKAVEDVVKKRLNRTDLEFEKELWHAADRLRGNIDSSEYKHIVLGLLFLKYVSDSFYYRRNKLKKWTADSKNKQYYISSEKERSVIMNDKDQYRGVGVFFIPEKARWEYLQDRAGHADIGKYIDEAIEAIERANPGPLKDVLPKIYTASSLEGYVLGELVNIFSRIRFDHDIDKERDILGRVYEYFLGQFASAEGKRGGEFYSPRPIVRLLVKILEPFENARVFDPSCGSGGMFVQSSQFLKERYKDSTKVSISGQESNPTTWRLCKMNLAVRGIAGKIERGNSYYDDKFPNVRADFVLANPPFNAEWDPARLSDKDPRLTYGTPPSGNANFMWIQHFLHHLAPNGMAGFVMANGALAVGGKEGKIREKIIEAGLVDVIVACPPKLFYSVALPVSLWFLTKNKKNGRFRKREDETLFIDAREIFEQISRKQVAFTDEHIQKIAGTVRAWRGEEGAGAYKDIPGYCAVATKKDIAKHGYVLTPGRYVGVPDEVNDGVPFEEKMEKLSTELEQYFKESDTLEKQIQQNIKKVGQSQ